MSDEFKQEAKKSEGLASKVRTGLDISMIGFMIGAAFNAGIVYNKIGQMDSRISTSEDDIKQIQKDEQPLSERVARMEAILQDIRDELHQQNQSRK